MFGLGLLKGLSVTMRHFVDSYVYDRKPWEPRYSQEWLDKHQAIELVGHHHAFDRVGDEFPAGQRVAHTRMAHGDAVAHADDVELQWRATGHPDTCFHCLAHLFEVNVARHDIVVRVDHPDEGTGQFLGRQSGGVKKTPVRSPLETLFC